MVLLALLGMIAVQTPRLPTPDVHPPCPGEAPDSDKDGLSDLCESFLLQAFAPSLVASERACNWDESSGRLQGGYLVGAHPIENGVRLAYLPAYLRDCGLSGPKCLLRPFGGCDPHEGDSEAVFIEIAEAGQTGEWNPTRVFLSAHCFGQLDGRCRWYEPEDLRWEGDSPVVWVAEGKNANYPSKSACDSGHLQFDTCDKNGRAFLFPVLSPLQNIGAPLNPFPHQVEDPACVEGSELPWTWEADGTECIWSSRRFRGWSSTSSDGSTGYWRYLRDFGGFGKSGTPGDQP